MRRRRRGRARRSAPRRRPRGPPAASWSRTTTARLPGRIGYAAPSSSPRTAASISRSSPAQRPDPAAEPRSRALGRRAATSRPSRTTCTKRASGKSRTRVCAWRMFARARLDQPARHRAARAATGRARGRRGRIAVVGAAEVARSRSRGGLSTTTAARPGSPSRALPPRPAQQAHEVVEADLAAEERRHAPLVVVKARRHGHRDEPGVGVEEPADQLGAARRGAPHEDHLGALGQDQALGCAARVRS